MAVAIAGTSTVAELASGTSITCSVPAGVTAGELLVAAVTTVNTAAIPNQTGWAKIGQGAAPSTGPSTALFYRVAGASEPASYTFSGLASGHLTAEMVRVSGADNTNPLDAAAVTAGATSSTTLTVPTMTTASAGALVVSALAVYSQSASISAASGNPATIVANSTGTGRRLVMASESRPTPGAVGSRAWTTGSSLNWAGISVAFKPASVAAVSATVVGATATATALAGAGSLIVGPSVGATVVGATALATATSAAGTATVPHLTIAVTAEPGYSPPRVRIDVTDNRYMPATQVTITRRDPDGHSYPVRTSDGGPLLMSAGSATIWDYEAPYGVPLNYSTDASPDTATVELDCDDVWLIHPGVPAKSCRIKVTALPQRTRATRRGLHQVLGAAQPIPISSGARSTAAAPMSLRTFTDDDRQALDQILDDDAALRLNIPPSKPWGWDTCYISVGDLTENRTVAYGRFPWREWVLPIQVCGRPGGGTQAGITWNTVAAQYPTWQAIIDAGITSWADLAAPTS